MEPLIRPIRGFVQSTNYIYLIEMIVIVAILSLLGFIFYQLGLFKKNE